MLLEEYAAVKAEVASKLAALPFVAITVDGWSQVDIQSDTANMADVLFGATAVEMHYEQQAGGAMVTRLRYGDSQVLYLAAIVDPRFKMLDFQFSPAQFSQAEQVLSRLVTVDGSQADQPVVMALEQLRRGWGASCKTHARRLRGPFVPRALVVTVNWRQLTGSGFGQLLGVDVLKEKHYRTEVLDELYKEVKQATMKELREVVEEGFMIVSDGWKSKFAGCGTPLVNFLVLKLDGGVLLLRVVDVSGKRKDAEAIMDLHLEVVEELRKELAVEKVTCPFSCPFPGLWDTGLRNTDPL
ncbi:hypothetical protein QJQ45_024556, partial [Haematococcus lacustris]